MTVMFSGIVSGEKDVEASNLNHVHGGTKHVASWVRGDFDTCMGVCGVEGNGLDHGKSGEDIGFSV